MSFAAYRSERGLSLEQCCAELALSPSSKSWLSEIENGKRDASLRLALRIERWSGGKVPAGSVCKELADHDLSPAGEPGLPDAPADDATVAPGGDLGAGAEIEIVQ